MTLSQIRRLHLKLDLPDLYPHLDLKPVTTAERFIFDDPLTAEHALPGIGNRAAAALVQANLIPAAEATSEADVRRELAQLQRKLVIHIAHYVSISTVLLVAQVFCCCRLGRDSLGTPELGG